MAEGTDTAASRREPGELERLGCRIEGQNEQLVNASERLERLSDRILGSIPRETEKLTKIHPAPDEPDPPGINYMSQALDRMASLSDRLHAAIQRLEGL